MNKNIAAGVIFICICGIFAIFLKGKYADTNTTYFAVLPHFSIAEKTINYQYQLMKKTYNLNDDNVNILLISPDHYKA